MINNDKLQICKELLCYAVSDSLDFQFKKIRPLCLVKSQPDISKRFCMFFLVKKSSYELIRNFGNYAYEFFLVIEIPIGFTWLTLVAMRKL